MAADDAYEALQGAEPLRLGKPQPRILWGAAPRLRSARGGALSVGLARMMILPDRPIPSACGTIVPIPKALEPRLWACQAGIDKAYSWRHRESQISNGSSDNAIYATAAAGRFSRTPRRCRMW
jgi:hypothetical protein